MATTVHLRRVEDADLGPLFEFQRDPEARRQAAFTAPATEELSGYVAWWRRVEASPDVVARAIEHEGALAGSILSWVQEGEREVSYWIDRERCGRGIATAALAAFMEVLADRPLHARAAADNAASIRVLEKCGFQHLARERGFAHERGEEIDEVVMIRKA